MAFDVLDQNITQLFKNDDTFFIPRYQRNYVWRELNWSQLIKDIRYCAEVTPDWSHFIGSMVFERKQSSGGMVDIIDGQQRILTLQVVIFALIYCYQNIKNKSDNKTIIKQCEGNITYLQDLITNRTLGNAETIKLESTYEEFVELNRDIMELREDSIAKYNNLINNPQKEKNIILQAFKYFVNDFIDLSFDELLILTKQFLNTRVITISSMKEEEVYNIFEILNARGVKLKQIELLKNYLFKYLKPRAQLDTYKNKWSELEKLLENVDLDDYYLHIFRCWYYKNKLVKEQLFEVTKEQLRKGDKDELSNFFDFFIRCSTFYRAIDDAEGNLIEAEVYEYFKLKQNKQVRSTLLALRLRKEEKLLEEGKYGKFLILLRNFYVAFNLDNGVSNKIENDIYVLSNEIFKARESRQIEYAVFKFLKKFSTYFNKSDILENGLKNIIYTNKSKRKNVSSKLLVYFLKPLLLECEENKYIQYDFAKFNIEHILNDNSEENIRYFLGNLLLCPNNLNSIMHDFPYEKKREKLLVSGIPYLKKFAEKYEKFDETHIAERSIEVANKLKDIYSISKEYIDDNFSKLQIYFALKEQLEIAFGENNGYIKELEVRGVNKFIQYVYSNGELPKDEIIKLKKLLPQTA